jgi:hypothetical protein
VDQPGDPAFVLQIALKRVLAEFMDEQGQVDYAALKVSPAYATFQDQTALLRTFDPFFLSTREEKLAFWINLYNTLILDAVISLNIKRTITEQMAGVGFLQRAAYIVGGQRLSADDIEHGILRSNRGHPYFYTPQFRSDDQRLSWVVAPFEARIHFALNCASRSCPPIRTYLAQNIEDQLAMAARNFISSDLELVTGRNKIRLSYIFKWFAGDFGGHVGLIDFILAQLDDQGSVDWMKTNRNKIKFSFKPNVWSLNGKV